VYGVLSTLCRRYFTCALKHAQELAQQVRIAATKSRAGYVEMQEQVRRCGLVSCNHGTATADALGSTSRCVGQYKRWQELWQHEVRVMLRHHLCDHFFNFFTGSFSCDLSSTAAALLSGGDDAVGCFLGGTF
jgi:chemotaxis regulatin CheY-phosphate phosphatase CheZ